MFERFTKYFILIWLICNLIALPAAAVYNEDISYFSKEIKKEQNNIGLFGKIDSISNGFVLNKNEKIVLLNGKIINDKKSIINNNEKTNTNVPIKTKKPLFLIYIVWFLIIILFLAVIKTKKSQAVITDLFIAVFIFILLASTIVFVWNRYSTRFNEDLEYKDMQLKALMISDLLIKTKGYPESWELDPSSVEILGLASSDRILSEEKITALISDTDHKNATRLLGLSAFNLSLQLNYLNGTLISDYGSNSTGQLSVSIKRIVNYKNEKIIFETRVWK